LKFLKADNDNGTYDPYPIFTISVKDKKTGKELAWTKIGHSYGLYISFH
jgi:hypothetical protein